MPQPNELRIGDIVKFRCYGKTVMGAITDFTPDLFGGPALIVVKIKRERERERERERSQSIRKA